MSEKEKPGAEGTANRADDLAEAILDDKPFQNLRAQAALHGIGLYALAGGGYLVTKWGLARELTGLSDVGALLAQMGVR